MDSLLILALSALCRAWGEETAPARPANAVHGVISDRRGVAVSGIAVQLYPSSSQSFACGAPSVTDARGRYRLEIPDTLICDQRPVRGLRTIYLKLSPHGTGSDTENLLGPYYHAIPRSALSADFRLDFTIPRLPLEMGGCSSRLDLSTEAIVTGRVVDSLGNALAGARVLLRAAGDTEPMGWAETNTQGRYRADPPRNCRDHPLSLPTTLSLSLETPPGYISDHPPAWRQVAIGSEATGVTVDWDLSAERPAPWRVAAGRLCVETTLEGRPFSEGYLSLIPMPGPGRNAHWLHRLGQGRACFSGVAPGDYELELTPRTFGVLSASAATPRIYPLATVSGEALAGSRIRFDRRGRATLHPAKNAPRPIAGSLRINIQPRAPRAKQSLSATLRFPPGARAGEPALLLAQTVDEMRVGRDENYRLAWISASSGTRAVELPVDPGRLSRWSVRSDRFGIRVTRLGGPGGRTPQQLDVQMTPSGSIEGTIFLPDGRPFTPHAGSDPERIRLISVKAVPYWYDTLSADGDYADERGGYRLTGLAPGFYRLVTYWQGRDFTWSAPSGEGLRVKAGETLRRDIRLDEPADVEVAADRRDGEPYAGIDDGEIHFWDAPPRERWVVGVPSGRQEEFMPSCLLMAQASEAPFAFLQSSAGSWIPQIGRGQGTRTRVAPGRYDVYSFETTHRFKSPSLRVTGIEREVVIAPRTLTTLRFRSSGLGSARFSGTLKKPKLPALKELARVRSACELHQRLVPRVELRHPSGELAAAAFPPLSFEALGGALGALEQGNALDLAEFADAWPYRFELDSLPAGEYQARLAAPDLTRNLNFRLDDGATRRLETDD